MADEDQFTGWAEYYDMIYEGENPEEKRFYLEEMEKADGKVLEVGCGTGRILLPGLEKGIDVYGFDISREMIERLEEKAEERGLEPDVRVADMMDFSYDEEFSLITIPFRTFLHNLNAGEMVSTLECCREHLEEGGKLVLNFYLPDYEKIAEGDGAVNTSELERGGESFTREVEVYWGSELEEVRVIENRMYRGDEKVWESKFKTKVISKNEFELALKAAGFENWTVYGGFDREELESTDQEAVWIIEV